MKRVPIILPALLLSVLVIGCIDLDQFITPIVFNPTELESYQLGEYKDAELGKEVNALFPDTAITNKFEVHSFSNGKNTIYAYYLHHSYSPSTTVFYCHGNTHSIDNYWPRAKLLYQTGYDVFIFDYRGFGKSTGAITESGMVQDSHKALEYLVDELGVIKSEILIYGFSLGSVPAVNVAAYGDMDDAIGLVLEAPVGSVDLYVQDSTYLSLPGSFLTTYSLDNMTTIKEVSIPLLWIHGDEDTLNRMETHGQPVFDASPSAKKFAEIVKGASHSDIPLIMGSDFSSYITEITKFIEGE